MPGVKHQHRRTHLLLTAAILQMKSRRHRDTGRVTDRALILQTAGAHIHVLAPSWRPGDSRCFCRSNSRGENLRSCGCAPRAHLAPHSHGIWLSRSLAPNLMVKPTVFPRLLAAFCSACVSASRHFTLLGSTQLSPRDCESGTTHVPFSGPCSLAHLALSSAHCSLQVERLSVGHLSARALGFPCLQQLL